ncbi:hypothetical protein SAM19_03410 [Brevibacillus laterosporus]|nr:hypothetical protein [Brevibacillus laterosporus]
MGYELCASLEKIHGGKGKSPFHIEKGLTTDNKIGVDVHFTIFMDEFL